MVIKPETPPTPEVQRYSSLVQILFKKTLFVFSQTFVTWDAPTSLTLLAYLLALQKEW